MFLLLGAAAGVGGVMAWRKWATPFFNPQQESAPRKRQEPSLQHDEYKKMQLQLEKYKEDKRKGPCKILSLNVNVIFLYYGLLKISEKSIW